MRSNLLALLAGRLVDDQVYPSASWNGYAHQRRASPRLLFILVPRWRVFRIASSCVRLFQPHFCRGCTPLSELSKWRRPSSTKGFVRASKEFWTYLEDNY